MEIILAAVENELADAWDRWCGDFPGVRIHRGSILDLSCYAVVSPANSFGFMDGGIDAVYLRAFGVAVQERLHQVIREQHHGELLVGTAAMVETNHSRIPYMIAAPTMRVPMRLVDSVNPYLAARAALLLVKHKQVGQEIRSIAFPGLGTGVGGVGSNTCARQMRAAIEDVLLGARSYPQTWAEASARHQALYTDLPQRLQH